jgi:hypothetical protein
VGVQARAPRGLGCRGPTSRTCTLRPCRPPEAQALPALGARPPRPVLLWAERCALRELAVGREGRRCVADEAREPLLLLAAAFQVEWGASPGYALLGDLLATAHATAHDTAHAT